MAKKWNEYTRREKAIGIIGAVFGVFVIGSFANGINSSSPTTTTPENSTTTTEQNAPQSVTTTKEVTETQTVAFEKKTVKSASYNKGTTRVTTPGIKGEKTLTYKVTLVDGVESKRELISEQVTRSPVSEITTIGTYIKPAAPKVQKTSNCDPNYAGACVPIASDVDCAGGSGNGPAYVSGSVRVIGRDIYDLDRDGDGIGCE